MWKKVGAVLLAAAYFASPIDLIPDFIPVAGQVDDLAVIVWAAKCVLARGGTPKAGTKDIHA